MGKELTMAVANFLLYFEIALLVAMACVLAFRLFAPMRWRHKLTHIVRHGIPHHS